MDLKQILNLHNQGFSNRKVVVPLGISRNTINTYIKRFKCSKYSLEHYRRKYAKVKGSLKLEHDSGSEMFVDYAGTKLEIINRQTGEVIPLEVFVAILSNSHYIYVEACISQKREDFISCCSNAFNFYGGVPKEIVPDNLKSAVTRASKHESTINRNFKDFARHYNCVINSKSAYASKIRP